MIGKSTACILTFLIGLGVLCFVQNLYFSHTLLGGDEMLARKELLSSFVGLSDLPLVCEAHYVRHRSISDVFAYFNESPELLEYFPSTFVYRYTPLAQPSRIDYAF